MKSSIIELFKYGFLYFYRLMLFMAYISDFIVLLVAILHFWILILEMFLWTKPIGLKIFRQSLNQAISTKVLGANQGLYNGFLSAGLFWSLLHPSLIVSYQLKIYFLSCVAIAGIYGAITLKNKRVFLIQGGPPLLAILIMFISVK